jgi:hypothetical protein
MNKMDGITLHPDLREFLQLLGECQVEYLLVGGYALAAHGHVRYTKDIDFWVAPNPDNVDRVIRVLERFGFTDLEDVDQTLRSTDGIVTLGREPARIDLLTHIPGLDFQVARKRKIETRIAGIPVSVICREDLVSAKLASNRLRDRADLEELGVPEALVRKTLLNGPKDA